MMERKSLGSNWVCFLTAMDSPCGQAVDFGHKPRSKYFTPIWREFGHRLDVLRFPGIGQSIRFVIAVEILANSARIRRARSITTKVAVQPEAKEKRTPVQTPAFRIYDGASSRRPALCARERGPALGSGSGGTLFPRYVDYPRNLLTAFGIVCNIADLVQQYSKNKSRPGPSR